MSSRNLKGFWGLFVLVMLWGMQTQAEPRHARLSAAIHRPMLSPARHFPRPMAERTPFRFKTPPVQPVEAGKPRPKTWLPHKKHRVSSQAPAVLPQPAPPSDEPPPAGEIPVRWAKPAHPGQFVKIFAAPTFSSANIGELRSHSALLVGETQTTRSGVCRTWLATIPVGFVCAAQVAIESGYLSSPPEREKSTGWQRFRYGVVSALITKIQGTGGRYLRKVLHRGDGVTVAKANGPSFELIGRERLPSKDVKVVTPPKAPTIDWASVPPGFRPGWVVPPVGEETVPLFFGTGDGEPVAYLPRYAVVYLAESALVQKGRVSVTPKDAAALVAKGNRKPAWVASAELQIEEPHLRRIVPATPPDSVSQDEPWIDIHLGQQVATAYRGSKPVFAALVSTGVAGATPPGVFFIYRKYLSQTMANLAGAASQYDYREVPHAQFFNGRIGLHAVLWHDNLGHAVSHGCVNLSPQAAEQFFAFTQPDLPVGWHTITLPSRKQPAPRSGLRGTVVQVRK